MVSVKPIHEMVLDASPYYNKKGKPEAEHMIVYDSTSETLEPIYFFILDLLNDIGMKPEKLIDNFSATPGSGYFAELGTRATRMQDEAMKIFGTINNVLRSVLNLIYDLKEFRIRLNHYKALTSNNKADKVAARLSLKQLWMDKVDLAKQNSSIKAMALGQAGFQTLIDAFLVSDSLKDVDKLDLNDQVKRVLKPRVQEFNNWVKQSEQELTKRYELEKTYLRSQVSSLKLYSRWLRPYLENASKLEQKESGRNPDLVNTFNTVVLGLTLFGKQEIKPKEAALANDLPEDFKKLKLKRKYYACLLVDFSFRSLPQRAGQQQYVFGGRAEVTFRSYALNEDEIAKLNEKLDKSDIGDVVALMEGASTESMKHLEAEINSFLEEESGNVKEKSNDASNPFLALIGYYDRSSKKKDSSRKKIVEVRQDDWIEKTHLRSYAAKTAKNVAFGIFDRYKKAHGMPSYT